MIDVRPGLVLAGVLGLVVAAIALLPVLRGLGRHRGVWPQLGAAAITLALLLPVVLLILDQTQHFRARGLTEVGSAAFEEPPMSESAALAMRDALEPGNSWAVVTEFGRCADIHLYAFYWLAFRLVPVAPDCVDPDVELYLEIEPPRDAVVIDRGPDFWVVRR
jgi:hypothetical protein